MTRISGTGFFSPDYFTARERFRRAAADAGGTLETIPLDAKGPGGEDLGIDTAWFGPQNPQRALLHMSGLHGVEGFAGSAIQLQFLQQLPSLPAGVAIVVIHILNPYGMAWLRRVNENNVDLNRNFLERHAHAGAPPVYSKLNGFLNPASPPAADFFFLRAACLIVRYGTSALTQAVAGGQYSYPRGLFFGGAKLEQGPVRLEAFLTNRLSSVERAAAVNVHTGLGKYAHDLLLTAHSDQRAGYTIEGGVESMIFRLFAKARPHFVRQEFGTFSGPRVLHALREENRCHHYGGAQLNHPAKRRMKQVFCPDDERWRQSVLNRGAELLRDWRF